MVNLLIDVTANSLLMSSLSAFFILLFGFVGALGFNSIKSHSTKLMLKQTSLVIFFIPSIFILTAAFVSINPFPFGLAGIVLIHVLSMAPFCALTIHHIMVQKISPFERLAIIEGANTWQFLKPAFIEIKKDLLSQFLFYFVITLSSFSVPFIVSHGFNTFEIAIYRSSFETNGIYEGLTIAAVELVLIYFILRRINIKNLDDQGLNAAPAKDFFLLRNPLGLVVILIPAFIIIGGLGSGLLKGFQQLDVLGISWDLLAPKIIKSFFISISLGALIIIFLIIFYRFFEYKKNMDRVYSIIVPSVALTGLIFWLPIFSFLSSELKFMIGFILFSITALMRLGPERVLKSLEKQILVAKTMGANSSFIYRKIVLPQLLDSISFVAAVGAFGALGEFAFSSMVFGNDSTLSLFAKSLLNQYRTEAASVIVVLILILGLFLYNIVRSIKYVYR